MDIGADLEFKSEKPGLTRGEGAREITGDNGRLVESVRRSDKMAGSKIAGLEKLNWMARNAVVRGQARDAGESAEGTIGAGEY